MVVQLHKVIVWIGDVLLDDSVVSIHFCEPVKGEYVDTEHGWGEDEELSSDVSLLAAHGVEDLFDKEEDSKDHSQSWEDVLNVEDW